MKELISSSMIRAPISVLRPSHPICIGEDTPVSTAIDLMKSKNIGCILIVENDKLKGIFTERDVLTRVLAKELDPRNIAIQEVMTPDPETLRTDDMVGFALNRMSLGSYRHIPLVDERNRPIGVISVRDVFKHLVQTPKVKGR